MASRAKPFSVGRGHWPRLAVAWPPNWPIWFAGALAAVIFLLNPVGYVGGGYDDFHYLTAARCAAEHGFCIPTDHWARRWPVVAPVGLVLRLFGESSVALAIVPLAYALTCVLLLAAVTTRQFGPRAGALAGIIFALTPVVSEAASGLGVDLSELAFVLVAILALQRAMARNDRRLFLLAGLAAGVAIQARPTALALLPVVIGTLLTARRPRDAALVLLAAALPSLAEALAYTAATGDPLLGWRLSLRHAHIPSSSLLPGVDTSRSPVLNPDFIAGWKRPMGIHVHWLIDGFLNYVFSPEVALPVCAAAGLLILDRKRLSASGRAADGLRFALLLAAGWFAILTYGMGVDPKPRIFVVISAVAAALLGALLAPRWRLSRLLVIAVVGLVVLKGMAAIEVRETLRPQETAAPAMIAGVPGIAIEPRTAQFLAMVPEARRLPAARGADEQRAVLVLGFDDCRHAAIDAGYPGWRVRRSFAPASATPAPLETLRRTGLFLDAAPRPVLCAIAR